MLLPGIAKSRKKGGPTISLQKLIQRTKMSSFLNTVKSGLSGSLDDKAKDARKVLDEKPIHAIKSHAKSGAVGGTLAPLLDVAGTTLEAGLTAPRGQRLQSMGRSLKDTQVGTIARQATGGALFGASTDVAKNQVERAAARTFLDKYEKRASLPMPKPPTANAGEGVAKSTGLFKGVATVNSLKPPGPAMSSVTMNPRKQLRHAMTPKV